MLDDVLIGIGLMLFSFFAGYLRGVAASDRAWSELLPRCDEGEGNAR